MTALKTEITAAEYAPDKIAFQVRPGVTPLVLDDSGFEYLGTRITDAGEAYKVFLSVFTEMKGNK